jgi:hypothetical protein
MQINRNGNPPINQADYLDMFVERMYEAAQAFKNVDRIL